MIELEMTLGVYVEQEAQEYVGTTRPVPRLHLRAPAGPATGTILTCCYAFSTACLGNAALQFVSRLDHPALNAIVCGQKHAVIP